MNRFEHWLIQDDKGLLTGFQHVAIWELEYKSISENHTGQIEGEGRANVGEFEIFGIRIAWVIHDLADDEIELVVGWWAKVGLRVDENSVIIRKRNGFTEIGEVSRVVSLGIVLFVATWAYRSLTEGDRVRG